MEIVRSHVELASVQLAAGQLAVINCRDNNVSHEIYPITNA